jgi:hypothetical protein
MRHVLAASILAAGLIAVLPTSSLAQPAYDHDERPPMDRHPPPPPPPHWHHPHHHHHVPPPHHPMPPPNYDRHPDHD